jgi:hypothetical protein
MGVAVLAGGGIIGYIYIADYYQTREKEAKRAKEAEALRVGSINNLDRFTIGTSQNDVLYRMGEPKTRYDTEGPPKWVFVDIVGEAHVWWAPNKTIVEISCKANYWDCQVAGVGEGTTEAELRTRLGTPTQDSPPESDGSKSLWYGPVSGRQFIFALTRGTVAAIYLTGGATK